MIACSNPETIGGDRFEYLVMSSRGVWGVWGGGEVGGGGWSGDE